MQNDKITQFIINVAQEVLSDLHLRLKNTRWSCRMEGTGWDAGTDLNYLKQLVAYWLDAYNWRERETTLNQFHHFRTEVEGIGIHFIHERSKGPNPFPLILTHGYPDSFYRFAKIIPMLTDPESFGGRAEDAFDIVVPDLPGHGFSDKPSKPGAMFRVNDLWARLMEEKLGYSRFGAHGGDWGAPLRNSSRAAIPIPL
jgi:pimeloyl-ACP methyl ester carboxylesterase